MIIYENDKAGFLDHAHTCDIEDVILSEYRERSFYSMRTDARDRFGTPLEKRFRAAEIRQMMSEAGLTDVRLSASPPFWCAVGFRASM